MKVGKMFEMRLSSLNHVPPGGFRYRHPQSGYLAEAHSYGMLRGLVDAHCAANALRPVTDDEMQQQMCEGLPPKSARTFCEGDGVSVDGVRITWQDVWHGTKVLGSFLLAGRPLVAREEAERRAAICAPCSRNVNYAKPCGSDCPELAATVEAIVGADGTTLDAELNACSVCKCSNKAQVWMPVEHLKRGVTDEMMPQFPDSCWKRAAILAMNTKTACVLTQTA